jgi:transposase
VKHYSSQRKESALQKMMPPNNISITQLSIEMGIGESTLYNWRKQAIDKGHLVPGNGKNAEQWSSANKFSVVLETTSLNQAELAEYCRNKGLYAEQISAWRSACMDANANVEEQEKTFTIETKKDKKQINQLEKELRRKHKALAETAALLVLRKKAIAIWGKSRMNDPRLSSHSNS